MFEKHCKHWQKEGMLDECENITHILRINCPYPKSPGSEIARKVLKNSPIKEVRILVSKQSDGGRFLTIDIEYEVGKKTHKKA